MSGEYHAFALDKRRIAAHFGKAAAHYDAHDFFQREVAARTLARLDYIKLDVARLIDLGSGTGRGAQALARRYDKARIHHCDIAWPMLDQARAQQRRWFSRHAYLCADIEALPLREQSFCLAFSSLALQWCADLQHGLREIHRILRPGGLFMFATLGPDTLHELRSAWSAVSDAPHVNQFVDLHVVGDALVAAGFADPVMEAELITVEYADVMTLMRDLKGIGAANAANARTRGLLGRRGLAALTAAYEPFRRDGKLPATYEVVYGHAWATGKPPPQHGEVQHFPLERLRRR